MNSQKTRQSIAMILTEDDVNEFYEACRSDGFELTLEEARFYALRTLRLYEILSRPLTAERARLAKTRPDATIQEALVQPQTSFPPQ